MYNRIEEIMKELIITTEQEKNMGMFTHLGTFLGYFFPFANLFVPLIIWQSNKESEFLDKHGKSVMNFQLSLFLYHLVGLIILLVFFLKNILELVGYAANDGDFFYNTNDGEFAGATIIALFSLFFYYFILQAIYIVTTIIGGIRASKGKLYTYPLSIRFIQ